MPHDPKLTSNSLFQAARIAKLTMQVRYPFGEADLRYSFLNEAGMPQQQHTDVRLLLNSGEAREIGALFLKLADAMEGMEGTKQ